MWNVFSALPLAPGPVVSVLDDDTIEVLNGHHTERARLNGIDCADVLLPDGTNVNHTLVKNGWCWWYRKYAPGNTLLEGLEKGARESEKGLWVDPAPASPWVLSPSEAGRKRTPGVYVEPSTYG